MKKQIVRKVGLAVAVLFVLTGTPFGQVETRNNSVPAATEIVVPAETSNSVPANAVESSVPAARVYCNVEPGSGHQYSFSFSLQQSLIWGILFGFSLALFGIAYWTPKQIKAEKEYTLFESDPGVSDEEFRELTTGEKRLIDAPKEFSQDRDDGKTFGYLADASDIYATHDRLQELWRKGESLSPEEKKILNLEVRIFNQTLLRQDASVLPSTTMRIFWGIFWGVLFLHAILNVWEGNIFYGLFVLLATIAFMIARRNSYKILTPDYLKHYHGDWIVKIYEGFWKFVGGATALGIAIGAAEAQRKNVTLYVDNDGDVVGYKEHPNSGCLTMLLSVGVGFLAGFFIFVFLQPILIFYLFGRYYYSRLPKTNDSSFPIKRNPLIFYVPAAAGLVMFILSFCFMYFSSPAEANSEPDNTEVVTTANPPKSANISAKIQDLSPNYDGQRPKTVEEKSTDALFEACRNASSTREQVMALITESNVNANVKGMTPLAIAVNRKNLVAVKALLDAGADPDFVMRNNQKISDYVARRGNENLQNLFKEAAMKKQKTIEIVPETPAKEKSDVPAELPEGVDPETFRELKAMVEGNQQ